MTPAELYARFRSDVDDAVAPYLWSDLEVYGYMSDAESMFCRLTGGLQDSTSPLTELEVTIGQATTPLSEKILYIRSASLRSTERDIKVLNYEDLSGGNNGRLYTKQYLNTAGPVTGIVLGMDEGLARLLQLPVANDTIDLLIDRLPLEAVTADGEFEIAEQHHLHLLIWMRHLAYGKQNADTFDKKKSDEEEVKFERYCLRAKVEKARRKHKPQLIRYGGI